MVNLDLWKFFLEFLTGFYNMYRPYTIVNIIIMFCLVCLFYVSWIFMFKRHKRLMIGSSCWMCFFCNIFINFSNITTRPVSSWLGESWAFMLRLYNWRHRWMDRGTGLDTIPIFNCFLLFYEYVYFNIIHLTFISIS